MKTKYLMILTLISSVSFAEHNDINDNYRDNENNQDIIYENYSDTKKHLTEDAINLCHNLKNCTENVLNGASTFCTEIAEALKNFNQAFIIDNNDYDNKKETLSLIKNYTLSIFHTFNGCWALFFKSGVKGVALGALYLCKDGICTLYHTGCVICQFSQIVNNKFNIFHNIFSSVKFMINTPLSVSKWCLGKLFL